MFNLINYSIMKIKHLVWLISLLMIIPFSLVSCKDDDEPQKEEQKNEENKEEGKNPTEELKEELPTDPNTAVVKILVLNEDNIPVQTTVYMFDNKSNVGYKSKALNYEDTDENGIVKFIINANDLNGNYKKSFYFWCEGDETFFGAKTEVILKAGEGKTDTIVKPARLAFDVSFFDRPFIIKYNKDLSTTIYAQIHFNYKNENLTIKDLNDNIIYDIYKENNELRDHMAKLPESRRIAEVVEDSLKLSMKISNIPLLNFKLDSDNDISVNGSPTDGLIGTTKSSYVGAYYNFDRNASYKFTEAKSSPTHVVSISSDDGESVIGLRKATLASNTDVASRAEKVLMVDENGKYVDELYGLGWVITKSNIYEIVDFKGGKLHCISLRTRGDYKLDLSDFEADLQ